MRATATNTGSDALPLRTRVVRKALIRTFGPPPVDPTRDPGDPGLTGPNSPSWRVIGEPAAIAGGVRGLLVQLVHPLAMAGVYDHSAFRTDPLGRLQRTSAYVTTSTFGSVPEALQVANIVRKVHLRVRGTAPDGRMYAADDPRLIVWVSVALTSSFLHAYQIWAPTRLSDADADRFVLEQSRISALLDPNVDVTGFMADPSTHESLRQGAVALPLLDRGELPRTVEELDACIAGFLPELGVNSQAKAAISFLRRPPLGFGPQFGYQMLLAGALGSLSDPVADALELHWPKPVRRAAVSFTRQALRVLRYTAGPSPTLTAAYDRAHAPVT